MSSKYDAVKVRVFVQDDHYYILSRFRLSRMLTFCRVPATAAVQIALDLKRCFVNDGRTSIKQAEVEAALRALLRAHGFGPAHLGLLSVMSTFYMQRVPLVLLIAGDTPHETTVFAQHVACKLNCLTVLNTELLLDMTDTLDAVQYNANACSDDGSEVTEVASIGAESAVRSTTIATTAAMATTNGATAEAGNEDQHLTWQRQCSRVRGAVVAELEHALCDGKVVIVEGQWLDLALYTDYLQASFQRARGAIVLAVQLRPSPAAGRIVGVYDSSHCCDVAPRHRGEHADNWHGKAAVRLPTRQCEQTSQSQQSDLRMVPLIFGAAHGEGGATPPSSSIALSAGGGDEAVVYDIHYDRPATLSRVEDCLHDIIVNRIMRELAARGIILDVVEGHAKLTSK